MKIEKVMLLLVSMAVAGVATAACPKTISGAFGGGWSDTWYQNGIALDSYFGDMTANFNGTTKTVNTNIRYVQRSNGYNDIETGRGTFVFSPDTCTGVATINDSAVGLITWNFVVTDNGNSVSMYVSNIQTQPPGVAVSGIFSLRRL